MLEPASRLKREEERVKERERSRPFLLGAQKNTLLYNQKHAPNISHLHFFSLSFGDQGGSHSERSRQAAPKQHQGRKFCSMNGWVET